GESPDPRASPRRVPAAGRAGARGGVRARGPRARRRYTHSTDTKSCGVLAMSSFKSAFALLQKIGKCMMLPVSVLPVAGILLGVGSANLWWLPDTVSQ